MGNDRVNYKVQGFLEEHREQVAEVKYAANLTVSGVFLGKKLDEVQIQATIKSKKELLDFITFLQYINPCFDD